MSMYVFMWIVDGRRKMGSLPAGGGGWEVAPFSGRDLGGVADYLVAVYDQSPLLPLLPLVEQGKVMSTTQITDCCHIRNHSSNT